MRLLKCKTLQTLDKSQFYAYYYAQCAFSDDIYLLTLLYGVILKTIQVQLLRLIFKDQPKMTWHVMKMQMYINSSLKFSKIYELTA